MKNLNDDGSKEAIDPHKDIDDLIEQSKIMLDEFCKTDAASNFAKLMGTEEFRIKIKDYIGAYLEELRNKWTDRR